jgi:hypothetical protein
MTADWLRPAEAAARFQVSERTLERWAAARWICRSKTGRIVHYRAADIAALIAAGSTPRKVVQIVPPASGSTDELDSFWRKAGVS